MGLVWAIILKELRVLARNRRVYRCFLGILALSMGGFWLFWEVEMPGGQRMDLSRRTRVARDLFVGISLVQLIVLGLVAPLVGSLMIAGERERKTFDLLWAAPLRRRHVLFGKWIAALIAILILSVGALPITSLVFQLGGVGLDEYLFMAVLICLTVATYAMVGLAVSAWCRKPTTALFASLLAILALSVGVVTLCAILDEINLVDMDSFADETDIPNILGWTVSPLMIWLGAMEHGLLEDTGLVAFALSRSGLFFLLHVLNQLMLFFLAAYVAKKGMARAEGSRAAIAKKPITDEQVLERRRKRFPYYIVDPLRRAQEIRDGQNPVFVKELRCGGWVKTTTLVRMTYVLILGSLFLAGFSIDGDHDAPLALTLAVLAILSPFVPVLAATGITREHESGTMDLLRTSLVQPRKVITAKIRLPLRALTAFFLALTVLPVGIVAEMAALSAHSGSAPSWDSSLAAGAETVGAYAMTLIPAWAALVFAVVVCVYVSSWFRRSILSLLGSYLAIGVLVFSPYLFKMLALLPWAIIGSVFRHTDFGRSLRGTSRGDSLQVTIDMICDPFLHIAAPVLSAPFYFTGHWWEGLTRRRLITAHLYDEVGGPSGMLLYVAATLLASVLLGAMAARRLRRTQRA